MQVKSGDTSQLKLMLTSAKLPAGLYTGQVQFKAEPTESKADPITQVTALEVRIREDDRIVDHLVREGETFFIPPNVPHAPVRPPDTIGIVVERRRPPGEHEHVIFYCDNCGALVEDIDFDCADIVNHFSQAMLDFWKDDARRTCKNCGHKVPKPEPVKPF